jgi:hypothetical protein
MGKVNLDNNEKVSDIENLSLTFFLRKIDMTFSQGAFDRGNTVIKFTACI